MTETAMAHALSLARRAAGSTSPNPPVGAVLVKNGAVVGEGHTQPAGGAHAEIEALAEAGEAAAGAELYVTLEPCSHWGRTPPCTDALIAAGVAAVHIAVLDPNPRVNGEGVRRLREHSITVTTGMCGDEAAELIEAHAKYITTGLPFVTLLLDPPAEVAASLEEAVDAVLSDEPQPPRAAALASRVRVPLRVLIGPVEAATTDERTVVVVPRGPVVQGRTAAQRVLSVPLADDALDFHSLLRELGRHEITSCLAAGTSTLATALLEQQVVDKIVAGADTAPPRDFAVAGGDTPGVFYPALRP